MSKESIVERLLEQKQISTFEAVILLKEHHTTVVKENNALPVFGPIPPLPAFPYSPSLPTPLYTPIC